MNTSENMKKHFFSPSNDHGPDVEEGRIGTACRFTVVVQKQMYVDLACRLIPQ
jgi:hypothetical protein